MASPIDLDRDNAFRKISLPTKQYSAIPASFEFDLGPQPSVLIFSVDPQERVAGDPIIGGFLAQVAEQRSPTRAYDRLPRLAADKRGNVYVSGPGGIWTLSPEGAPLGTIVGPEHPHNFTFGDEDGKTLYLCAKSSIYRIRLNVEGIRP